MKTIEYYQQNPVIESCDSIVIVRDLNDRFIASSPQLSMYSGIDPLELVGLSDRDMPWADHTDAFKQHSLATLCGDLKTEIHHINNIYFLAQKQILLNDQGTTAGTSTTVTPISQHSIDSLINSAQPTLYRIDKLSTVENQVLQLLAQDLKRKQIVEHIDMTLDGYDNILRRLKKKFSVKSTLQLIIQATQRDMFISPDKQYP